MSTDGQPLTPFQAARIRDAAYARGLRDGATIAFEKFSETTGIELQRAWSNALAHLDAIAPLHADD